MNKKHIFKDLLKSRFGILGWAFVMLLTNLLTAQAQDNGKLLWTANWSSDGQYIAVGGVDKQIRLYSGQTFELLKVIENQAEVLRMSWHPQENLLAIAGSQNGSKLYNVDRDSVIELMGEKGHGSRAVAWNHSGSMFAIADYEGEIAIWSKQGQLMREIKKSNTVSNVAIDWHPTKNEFVVLSDSVRVYDADGNKLQQFSHRQEAVLMLCVAWHKSGKFFALGDYGDQYVKLPAMLQFWDTDANLMSSSSISKAEYRNLSWTNNGKKLATASDALRIWNRHGKLIAEGQSADLLWGVDWSPNGKYVITSSENGHIRLWDKQAHFIRELNY